MSARSTTSVFAFGTSRPDSMIVVQTSTSASRSQKRDHLALERVLVHLPVRDDDPRVGDAPGAAMPASPVDRGHAVVDPEHLTLAEQLAPHRPKRELLVERADEREDRLAVLRRRVDRATSTGSR